MEQFDRQGRKCAACGSSEHKNPCTNGEGGWCADHDHHTKQFRGVVCWPCNMALGFVADSAARLRALADYLENAAVNTLIAAAGCAVEVCI